MEVVNVRFVSAKSSLIELSFTKDTKRAKDGGVFTVTGKAHPRVVAVVQSPREGQQELEGGGVEASRIRHSYSHI